MKFNLRDQILSEKMDGVLLQEMINEIVSPLITAVQDKKYSLSVEYYPQHEVKGRYRLNTDPYLHFIFRHLKKMGFWITIDSIGDDNEWLNMTVRTLFYNENRFTSKKYKGFHLCDELLLAQINEEILQKHIDNITKLIREADHEVVSGTVYNKVTYTYVNADHLQPKYDPYLHFIYKYFTENGFCISNMTPDGKISIFNSYSQFI